MPPSTTTRRRRHCEVRKKTLRARFTFKTYGGIETAHNASSQNARDDHVGATIDPLCGAVIAERWSSNLLGGVGRRACGLSDLTARVRVRRNLARRTREKTALIVTRLWRSLLRRALERSRCKSKGFFLRIFSRTH